jgi:hypothetical protein
MHFKNTATTACLLLIWSLLVGCATPFPTPNIAPLAGEVTPSGNTLFDLTLRAHGGEKLSQLRDVNVGLDGKWKQLIRRIQPLVTDFKYRVRSQERLLPQQGIYAAHYQGPAGSKAVFRSPDQIRVWYNNDPSEDAAVLSSTALTGDAFHLFLLGPLALEQWRDNFQRISDAELNNKTYYRIYLERVPGFGFSTRDEVVLWIDPDNYLTKLIQITLEGHETIQGAHVEVEYLDYIEHRGYVFPSRFFERVNAPIAIDAHAWHLTGLDINRDYQIDDINGKTLTGEAANEAAPLLP